MRIKASQSEVLSDVYIDFDTSFNSGVNVTGDKYKGDTVDDSLRNTAKFEAEFLIEHIPYMGEAHSIAKYIYEELSPKGVENKSGCVGSGSAWESFKVENKVVISDHIVNSTKYFFVGKDSLLSKIAEVKG